MSLDFHKRLIVYFFYDSDGIADDYVFHCLRALRPFCGNLAVVVNGNLSLDSKKNFLTVTPDLTVRENRGFDFEAYREILRRESREGRIEKYDEIVFTNFTCFGPVRPFDEMFAAEDARNDLDFWGLSFHPGMKTDPFGMIPGGKLPPHLQSCFLAVRKRMFSAPAFREFWETMPKIRTYAETVALFEARFTQYFADRGFRYDAYTGRDIRPEVAHPMLQTPLELVRERNLPLVKRKFFFLAPCDALSSPVQEKAQDLLDFLKKENFYDIRLILINLIRTSHMCDLLRNLHLDFILPEDYSGENRIPISRTALVLYVPSAPNPDRTKLQAMKIPPDVPIFIVSPGSMDFPRAAKFFPQGNLSPLDAMFTAARALRKDFDFFCFADLSAPEAANTLFPGSNFSGIVRLFHERPELGILFTPAPASTEMFSGFFREWGDCYPEAEAFANTLKTKVPLSPDKPPIAPAHACFFFRAEALDGMSTHTELAFLFLQAQANGFLTGRFFSLSAARSTLGDLTALLRESSTVSRPAGRTGREIAARFLNPGESFLFRAVRKYLPVSWRPALRKLCRIAGFRIRSMR